MLSRMTSVRPVTRVVTAHRQREGAGFIVRRPFPGADLGFADPFLLLDELGPVEYAPGEAIGAPDHPHRGFETVTYVLEGENEHEDSAGHRGTIGPGDVQWMTAGRGVVHSEEPSKALRERGGRSHGFQIWVNLPAKDKLTAPRYQEIPRTGIPQAVSPDGLATARVIAGDVFGCRAVIETRTPIALHDWTLAPGASIEVPLPPSFAAYVYVFRGDARVGDAVLHDGQLAVLGDGDAVHLLASIQPRGPSAALTPGGEPQASSGEARLLLLAGVPLREPVASYGPFVMNTRDELVQAVQDYQAGRMGEIRRDAAGQPR
jgi:redox-sensitive bicupin YhaK (pirin superfamily)